MIKCCLKYGIIFGILLKFVDPLFFYRFISRFYVPDLLPELQWNIYLLIIILSLVIYFIVGLLLAKIQKFSLKEILLITAIIWLVLLIADLNVIFSYIIYKAVLYWHYIFLFPGILIGYYTGELFKRKFGNNKAEDIKIVLGTNGEGAKIEQEIKS